MQRFAVFLSVVFLTASSICSVVGAAAGCANQPCCCHNATVDCRMTDDATIRSAHGFCCQQAGNRTCALSPDRQLYAIGWALSSTHHKLTPASSPAATTISTTSISHRPYFSSGVVNPYTHTGASSIFLSVMSFLC
jgi:hypothetical protein